MSTPVDPTLVNLLGTNDDGPFEGFIPPEMSAPIFQQAVRQSVAMQLVPQTPLGPTGKQFPVFTGTPAAEWVSEAGAKPISTGSVSMRNFRPEKIAGIFVVSAELVRSNPAGFIQNMRSKMAESFAVAFDNAFFHGTGSGSSTSPFSQNLDQTTKVVELGTASVDDGGIWQDFVSGMRLLVQDPVKKRQFRGIALDDTVEPDLMGAVDGNGRPLFVESPYTGDIPAVRTGSLMGRRLRLTSDLQGDSDFVGYMGDFSKAVWGVVGGITWDSTDQTSLPIGPEGEMVSLWQHNLLAVRAEAEYGFLIDDPQDFVKFSIAEPEPEDPEALTSNVEGTV